ncbi:hypothetical protein G5V59_03315 [Nocardioides sp. W3-2-3]|uniref:hypothetical protein n=1 Tax=Nocardioides convexus TaxID=2712224 RepID=UPI0031011A46|nr:hypothetical protein [Nocardioides convexus]
MVRRTSSSTSRCGCVRRQGSPRRCDLSSRRAATCSPGAPGPAAAPPARLRADPGRSARAHLRRAAAERLRAPRPRLVPQPRQRPRLPRLPREDAGSRSTGPSSRPSSRSSSPAPTGSSAPTRGWSARSSPGSPACSASR